MTQHLKQTPDPVAPGADFQLCWDGDRPATVVITFTPDTIPPVTVTFEAGAPACEQVHCPANAVGGLATPPDGSEDLALGIQP